jgi:hypothetical protein
MRVVHLHPAHVSTRDSTEPAANSSSMAEGSRAVDSPARQSRQSGHRNSASRLFIRHDRTESVGG